MLWSRSPLSLEKCLIENDNQVLKYYIVKSVSSNKFHVFVLVIQLIYEQRKQLETLSVAGRSFQVHKYLYIIILLFTQENKVNHTLDGIRDRARAGEYWPLKLLFRTFVFKCQSSKFPENGFAGVGEYCLLTYYSGHVYSSDKP